MIRLGARLAVSGGRESVVRLVLTALGVAIGTTLLLLCAAADPAIRAHQRGEAWQHTGREQSELEGSGAPLLWRLQTDVVDRREIAVLRVAAGGPDAPVPLGLSHVPEPGEVFVSPPLAALIEHLPADRLADRFPSAPSGTIGPDHLVGPDELVAVIGSPPEALGGDGGMEVHHVRTKPAPLQFTDFLRIVLGIGAVGLLMPVVVFVSTSTRLGAARREQRFAALRLAGATPRQTNVIAAVEAGAAAVVGAGLGAVGFMLTRSWAAAVEIDGQRSFVSDVHVGPVLMTIILVAVPALAVVAAMASLRRLQISPLGVARRAVRPRPTARRVLPVVAGTAGFVVSLGLFPRFGGMAGLVPVMATFALMIYGIVVAGPWLTVLCARGIRRVGRRTSTLLAGRRLEDDPAAGFRAVSGLVLAVFVASVCSGITPAGLAEARTDGDQLLKGSMLAASLPDGTTMARATPAISAARSAGAGHAVVLHEDPDPRRALGDPAVGRGRTAVVACTDLERLGVPGRCPAGGTAWIELENRPTIEPAPYTAAEAAVMPAEMLVLSTNGTAESTDRIRTAIARAVPGASTSTGAEAAAEATHRLTQITRLANLALAFTLVIAGCGLAVAVAGGIIERKRPFALLRLSGMQLGELQRVALLEAAAPLLLIAAASAVLGLATSAVIVTVASGDPWRPPTLGYWSSLAGGILAAVGVAAATLPLLGRVTAPSAVRFE